MSKLLMALWGAVGALLVLSPACTGAETTWKCVNVTYYNATLIDYDENGVASVGDCLQFPSTIAKQIDFTSSESVVAKLPAINGTAGSANEYASFVLNATCAGLQIVSLNSTAPSTTNNSSLVPPANFTCGDNQVIVGQLASPPSRITTTTGRGVGVPVSSCQQYGSDWEEDAGLCYPPCSTGYSGAGPLCLTDCPANFPDQGLECGKPSSYGRGAGSVWGGAGKVKWGGLWYPACAANFHNVGCCVCSPDCPAGTTDIGVSCQKGSYGRGVGKPLGCAVGQVYDAGLCYNQCPAGASGVGPLCYGGCTADDPYRLGIWCYNSESERDEILGAIIGGVIGGAILATVAAVTIPAVAVAATSAAVVGPAVVATGPLTESIMIAAAAFLPLAA